MTLSVATIVRGRSDGAAARFSDATDIQFAPGAVIAPAPADPALGGGAAAAPAIACSGASPHKRSSRMSARARNMRGLGITLSDNTQGKVWIRSVDANSGADEAGLRPNDQIVALDEKQINTYLDVVRYVNTKGASDDVTVYFPAKWQAGNADGVSGRRVRRALRRPGDRISGQREAASLQHPDVACAAHTRSRLRRAEYSRPLRSLTSRCGCRPAAGRVIADFSTDFSKVERMAEPSVRPCGYFGAAG